MKIRAEELQQKRKKKKRRRRRVEAGVSGWEKKWRRLVAFGMWSRNGDPLLDTKLKPRVRNAHHNVKVENLARPGTWTPPVACVGRSGWFD
ncbi:hypothetical protein MRB53_029488 [Persea americana]|uniref:Uncharacterized protein n=1 Tax=Persea americana TaxID=3435 RepID=A0ACC2KIH8_PERAE|nr:hypothetical protein MRB53_029488 [Persea americana]